VTKSKEVNAIDEKYNDAAYFSSSQVQLKDPAKMKPGKIFVQ